MKDAVLDKFLNLLKKEESVSRLLELLNILKECKKQGTCKNMCQLTQQERFYDDYDPQVDLEVKGFMIPQVVVDFGSQVHILPKEVQIKMGRLDLVSSKNFLKLVDQRFAKPISNLKYARNVDHGDTNCGRS